MRDTWGAPAGGWPSFGPDGRRLADDDQDDDEPVDPPPPNGWTRAPDD